MLQRKQTLFLLIALIVNGLLLFFPLADFLIGNELYSMYYNDFVYQEGKAMVDAPTLLPLTILLFGTLAVTFISIFMYKKRPLQIRLSVFNAIFMLGIPIFVVYMKIWGVSGDNVTSAFKVWGFLPVVSTIFTFAAIKNIIKDEALIKSLNRIR
ncbi:MAG: DUF4293 domain-containing protein [Bacteroidales bacterium]|nr:DUF4293 domain-containing protein [Bacteroidales bacterium]